MRISKDNSNRAFFSQLKRTRSLTVLSTAVVVSNGFAVPAVLATVARPPQFVELAFDGSQGLDRWRDTRSFAQQLKNERKNLDFTYFISGVYFVRGDKSKLYHAAGHPVGSSNIGWGENNNDTLLSRIDEVNKAIGEGHEMGSHAVGHFDGSKWTEKDWTTEFSDFNQFIFGVFSVNGLVPKPGQPSQINFQERDLVGFRAPLLAVSPGLWKTLNHFKFRYDTSLTGQQNYWPEKKPDGYWNFPLVSLKIAGTAKKTLSMDYNFYVSQSGGKPDPAHSAQYEQQMYESYLAYFRANYSGNRAPIHIGHHFSLWNGGAYWKAMKRFASTVCGLPEVRCVTYRELADFMDQTPESTRLAYKNAQFEKFTGDVIASLPESRRTFDLELGLTPANSGFVATVTGSDARILNESGLVVSVNEDPSSRTVAAVANLGDVEIARTTYAFEERRGFFFGRKKKVLVGRPLEERALKGDLPEAHNEQE